MLTVAQEPTHLPNATGPALSRTGVIVLLLGLAAIVVPTMASVARESWSTEQGAHGPIVLATGLWLAWKMWPGVRPAMRPAPSTMVALAAVLAMGGYALARVTQIVEVEGYFMYAVALVALYSLIGFEAMKRMWFPLFYLLFVFPPPEMVISAITNPLKIWISQGAIELLYALGYPIGGAGVMIQVGQYQLLVAAACSGLNSLISLSAISLFYVYIRHQANWRYALLLSLLVVPVAIIANFIRVLILILLTYHAGEAAAQGFLHNFAGITMFVIAILTIFAIDKVLEPIWNRWQSKKLRAEVAA